MISEKPAHFHAQWNRVNQKMVETGDWRKIRGWDWAEVQTAEIAREVAVAKKYLVRQANR